MRDLWSFLKTVVKLTITCEPKISWEVVALEDISKDEIIIKVDRDDQINIEQVIESVGDISLDSKFDCVEALAIFLCIEFKKGEKSKYLRMGQIFQDSVSRFILTSLKLSKYTAKGVQYSAGKVAR